MSRRTTEFQTIRSEGGLLPPDLLRRVVDPAGKVSGVEPTAYGLPAGERLNEAITQSWNRLRRHWAEFRAAAKGLPEGDAVTGLTNDKWSLPLLRELGFGFLATTAGPTIDGKTYAISRFAGNTAIHLVGCGVSLDRRAAGVRGAAQSNPHGLVQEFLNRSTAHLWAIASNGLSFRILRDNQALSRQSFLEFDLEAVFDGEVYSDFVLLWLIAHATRFLPRNDNRPDSCWLETWSKEAAEQGVAALTDLRGGVEKALEILGQGFVSHPKNTALREALRKGEVKLSDFHGQLLRVVYRLIFLFVAEDRELEGISLLHPPDKSDKARLARERYAAHYSTSRLRELASRIKGSRHGDLWRQFQFLVGAVYGDERFATMRDKLALPSLGSMLWNPASTALLNGPGLGDPGTELANVDFLEALRHLAFIRKDKILRPVDYKNLGSEEFGGVYESFLALTPQISGDGARFTFAEFAGNERKTSGSYYTPDSLVQCLLDSALDPVVQERLAGKTGKEAEKALLAIKVCDKAVGSGHFLVGAAHRLARHLARVRALAAGESEPSPLLYQTALRDVIGHCLYGVDINPMAVELCKVTLWLEALEPGKPLSFLDHHIRCGNSLLGATPELIKGGIPDEAYEAIEGDDKEACAALKKKNKRENPKLGDWFVADEAVLRDKLFHAAAAIDEMSDSRPEDIRRKEAAFRAAQSNYDFGKAWDLATLWCAAFVIKKHFPASAVSNSANANSPSAIPATPAQTQAVMFGGTDESPKLKKTKALSRAESEAAIGITTQHLRDFVEGGVLPDGLLAEANRLAEHYQFFHWHLAFPEVFAQGGFDVGLGNPPWDALSPDAREFFSTYNAQVRFEDREGQKRIIDTLLNDPTIATRWEEHCRDLYALVHFVKQSGRYRLFAPGNLGKGDFNVFRMFVEATVSHTRKGGWASQIVPEGLYNGANCMAIRRALFEECRLDCFWGFENANEVWFPDVDTRMKFCLYAAQVGGNTEFFRSAFNVRSKEALAEIRTGRCLRMPLQLVKTFSPDALAIMELASQQEIDIAEKMYRYPAFGDAAAGLPLRNYSAEIHMGNDRDLFENDAHGIPLCEGRMVAQYDHRAKGYCEGRGRSAEWVDLPFTKSGKPCQPQWFVASDKIPSKLGGRAFEFRACFCKVVSPTNERTLIATLIPPRALCGDSVPTILFEPAGYDWYHPFWIAIANSYAMDFIARMKVALNLTMTVMDSMPFPRPQPSERPVRELVGRSLRLLCTGPEMIPFWNKLAADSWVTTAKPNEIPGELDEQKRLQLRAEIDAIVARDIFGLTPSELEYILTTFPTQQRYQEEQYGEFRSRRLILESYAALAEAMQTGKVYQTPLNPPPADAQFGHPPRVVSAKLELPTGTRQPAPNPQVYLMQLTLLLLHRNQGTLTLDQMLDACSLLSLPDRLAGHAAVEDGEVAKRWRSRFREKIQPNLFLPILRDFIDRGVIRLKRDGSGTLVVLADTSAVPKNPEAEFDAGLALRVVNSLAAPELESLPEIVSDDDLVEFRKVG